MALSNFDRRRVNGPEDSFAPVYAPQNDQNERDPFQRRKRGPLDVRPIFLQPGLITQANGSAYIETEHTKIACAVYGPRQSKNVSYSESGHLNVEVKFAPFSCRRRRAPLRDAEDRTIAIAVHQAIVSSVRLELLPKSTIDVFVTVIEADGIEGVIASASIAVSTALADAGIEIFGLVVSCSASLIGGGIWLDPSEDEVSCSEGTIIVSCIPALGTVTSVWQGGQIPPKSVVDAMEKCQSRCTDIHKIVAQALRGYSSHNPT
ncbi:hypothetical protein AGABI1DRAFT_97612 [Agaricus bisporus var. burnettii JB137-S8]|uniref:Uncharacterized protein n=1 Tax=Agaricus bisporus var. burnettii (strain JB137-S8 / ATCC MYA-4627 / FGSC 10392) TaxID=597362 RepID=K5XGU6_AGABU|nr:uncharacterized protein AGABI1DRAFT_97612 [Agaricus bisporus var. burnettii JB137-S8]EKM82653.1 hypothetical protein AGABI1DRAFT_97612 [Agaricus bisporus var. burnettii JB137-S8]